MNELEQQVLAAIGGEATPIDQIVSDTGLPVPQVLSTLSVLEMRRLIRRLSGTRSSGRERSAATGNMPLVGWNGGEIQVQSGPSCACFCKDACSQPKNEVEWSGYGEVLAQTVPQMLISFSVENYRSFADEQTLSLEAVKDDAHPRPRRRLREVFAAKSLPPSTARTPPARAIC